MQTSEARRVSASIRNHLLTGAVTGVILAAAAIGWAAFTNLSGAVVASGHIVVDSYVKKVQHPTGGIISELLVQEGERVKAGQPLIRLDATETRANLAIVTKRLDELTARLARLEAERDDLPDIQFPKTLTGRMEIDDVASAVNSERKLFAFRRQARQGSKFQLLERIAQFEHEIDGLKAQEAAFRDGIVVLETEISSLSALRQQGIVSDQRLNGLKTQAATFGGERGEKVAYQAQVAGRISETRLQILQIDQELKSEVSRELREVQGQVGEFVERKVAAEDQLKRIEVTAPQDGIVHQLNFHTIGGVISPADVLMTIVPDNDRLAIDVRIQPQDIDQIVPDQPALVRLSAFNQRTTPELSAVVERIGADLSEDQRSGLSFYTVRLLLSASEVKRLGGLQMVPGMPAEAMIKTGDRTALSFILKPLSDQIARAFREN